MLTPKEMVEFELLIGDLIDGWKLKRDEFDDVAEQLIETIYLVFDEVAEELEE